MVLIPEVANHSSNALHPMVKSRHVGQFALSHCERLGRPCASVLFRECVGVVGPKTAVHIGEGGASVEEVKTSS